MKVVPLYLISLLFFSGCTRGINREAVVTRHNIEIEAVDTLNSLSLGNGRFAMTMDITGLQTFPLNYSKGVPLGTLSEWSWHSFPNTEGYNINETFNTLTIHGRKVPYAVQWPKDTRAGRAADYFRQNPHRFHLGTLGLHIIKSDGHIIRISDVKKIDQKLNLWEGELISHFEIEGIPVEVISWISQDKNDILGVKISSPLIREGRLGLDLNYPYPTGQFLDEASTYDKNEQARLKISFRDSKNLAISRKLGNIHYFSNFSSSVNLQPCHQTNEGYLIRPDSLNDSWTFLFGFSKTDSIIEEDYQKLQNKVHSDFTDFWISGGMIDFGKVKDPRAHELERRMILSLYLTKVNCGGNSPPQETGLTYNSWFGKPHLEMEWWHGVHFALWNRPGILEQQMDWYLRNYRTARLIANRQGYKGLRWPKMTDNEGGETGSSVGSYLIWQQPHIIYLAELLFQIKNDPDILNKYKDLVEQSALFMADFAWYDKSKQKYILGPGVMPAQESYDPSITYNPAFELAYWKWGLETAQKWRTRRGIARNESWDIILAKLSAVPQKEGQYISVESAPDSYTNPKYLTDHPSVLAIYGMLPLTEGLDKKLIKNTFDSVWQKWKWNETWGWDFPLTAMTATRLGFSGRAIDALLMPVATNTYLKNGHNYQNKTLRIYLPGNGGFLTALAMMAAGTEENKTAGKGFPKDWEIKYENLNRMP